MLNVTVVGGGIAGLAASLALRRAGHLVTIYERSSLSKEVGAAINVPPNASRPLLSWGLDPAKHKFVPADGISFCLPSNLQETNFVPMGDAFRKTFKAPHYFAHRVDLHESLKELATGAGIGSPVDIKLKADVLAYNCFNPSITLKGGEVVTGDVLICADGIHSKGADAVVEDIQSPQLHEPLNTCCRFLITADSLKEDPELFEFVKSTKNKLQLFIDKKGSRRIVCYPCRDNEIINFVVMYNDPSMGAESREDWHADANKSRVLEEFALYPKGLLKIIERAEHIKRWPLLSRKPIQSWVRGKTALAGDAVHPMLPHQGQGGAMAIEDGVALGIALANADPAQVPSRLKIYEKIRRNRASAMQILSLVSQEEVAQVADQVVPYFEGEPVPRNPQEFGKFNFGYDVVAESLKRVRESEPGFALPTTMFNETVPSSWQ